MQLIMLTWQNRSRLAEWAMKNYPPDWANEIVNRCIDDAAPPYEFWESHWHVNQFKMQKMVARGIARWLELEHENIQDIVLDLIDPTGYLNELYAQQGFEKACSFVYAQMNASDWLKRHAVNGSHRSALWIGAMEYVQMAILHDEWHQLRNQQISFFAREADNA